MTKITAHSGCEGTKMGSRDNILSALGLQADVIELDLRLIDGQVYLAHDEALMSQCISLKEALEWIKPTNALLNCDLKTCETFEPALNLLRIYGMEERTFFTGEYITNQYHDTAKYKHYCNIEQLEFIEQNKQITINQAKKMIELYYKNNDHTIAGYNINYLQLTKEVMILFKAAGISISCWTIDNHNEIEKYIEYGVDFITTNEVKYAKHILSMNYGIRQKEVIKKSYVFNTTHSKLNILVPFSLDHEYRGLEIKIYYWPKILQDKKEIIQEISKGITKIFPNDKMMLEQLIHDVKELNNLITVSMDYQGKYIGCAHRQSPFQVIRINEKEATQGFIPTKVIAGEYQVIISNHAIVSKQVYFTLVVTAFK